METTLKLAEYERQIDAYIEWIKTHPAAPYEERMEIRRKLTAVINEQNQYMNKIAKQNVIA